MTLHCIAATPETTTDVIDPGATPVLTVDPGDTVVVDSLDANGYLDGPDAELNGARLIPHARGHCLTGPIAVRGARPGSVLAVRFDSIVPGEWGWTVAGGRGTWLEERLGVADQPSRLLWTLDADGRRGTDRTVARRGSPHSSASSVSHPPSPASTRRSPRGRAPAATSTAGT